MFSAALQGSNTPYARAVCGISCISALAPLMERARGLNADSAWITARTKSGLSACRVECSTTRSSYWAERRLNTAFVVRKLEVPGAGAAIAAAVACIAGAATSYVFADGSFGLSESTRLPAPSRQAYIWACATEGVSAQSAAASRTD